MVARHPRAHVGLSLSTHPCPPPRLQAPEPNYRWDAAYKLNSEPLTKNSAIAVLHKLRDYATDHGVYTHAWLGTEVLTIKQLPADKGK